MLQQLRIGQNTGGLEQLGGDPESMGTGQQVHIDMGLLKAARYIVILLGAAQLLSLVVQALWLGGDVTLSRVLKVGLVAILGPCLIWAASGKELNLLRELQKRNRQLDQRGTGEQGAEPHDSSPLGRMSLPGSIPPAGTPG